ncbi:unnamed protein product [Microthlaspi erraticum]|uniref:F-box domain-containing protein n=1 Tax=Microthlaspi erraticum TaxID=1685480 RepID=A0A6D2K5K3_9BRAS|nr:unnamed protein product [Microthlaspi erraticum]
MPGPVLITMKRLEKRRRLGTIHSINSLPEDLIIEILTKLPPRSVSKLICVSKVWSSIIQGKHSTDFTGQFLTLPTLPRLTGESIFFGYEPVNDLYKVFSVRSIFDEHGHFVSGEHHVFTLGAQKTWRMIKCKFPHYPITQGICKNGVVHYQAWSFRPDKTSHVVVSLDMKSEEFNLRTLPDCVSGQYGTNLVIYNGKIALSNDSCGGKFDLWVLMDVNNQEWTKVSVSVPSWNDLVGKDRLCCRGTLSTGELLFEPFHIPYRYFIIYYNPKEDKARRVDFERSGDHWRIFLDHVESPMFLPRNVTV